MDKPTMDDVARRAGVSRSLVSLVFRGSPKVSDAARRSVETAALELGYRPNLAARQLASKRTFSVGLIINDLHNVFFPAVADAIHAVASGHGYRVLINNGMVEAESEQRALDNLVDLRVDAVIMAGTVLDAERITAAAEVLPVCVVCRTIDTSAFDTVDGDNEMGSALAVDHLVALGHRHIVHIDGGSGAGSDARRVGFSAAMARHGLAGRVLSGGYHEEAGARATRALLESVGLATGLRTGDGLPTAIYAANDLAAVGALGALREHGLRVPEDISVVGYDNTALAAYGAIGLTSIEQHRETIGGLAMEATIRRLDDRRRAAEHLVVPPALVARSTTGPAPR